MAVVDGSGKELPPSTKNYVAFHAQNVLGIAIKVRKILEYRTGLLPHGRLVLSHADDVLNVVGDRVGTMEVETAIEDQKAQEL